MYAMTAGLLEAAMMYHSMSGRPDQSTSCTLQGVASKNNKAASGCSDVDPTPRLVLYLSVSIHSSLCCSAHLILSNANE